MEERTETELAGVAAKTATGIRGLDEILRGGFPAGKATLVCGGAGSGKTLLGVEFLARGATQFGESGVHVSFEEDASEIAGNFVSFGFDLRALVARKQLAMEHVQVDAGQTVQGDDWSLDGLLARIALAVDTVGARRIVIDGIETLFSILEDEGQLRVELHRLIRWLKARNLTSLITTERGRDTISRHGIEEYVSDCVVFLDHRIHDQIATRRLRIVKYRGSGHGGDEYPFIIDREGVLVMPITSVGLDHRAVDERISSGIPGLDKVLGGTGYFRASSVLLSGTSGTGKSSLAGAMVHAACQRGERCLHFLFEESENQYLRNMRSIGMDLEPWLRSGLLTFHAVRPSLYGLESHLLTMQRLTDQLLPSVVVTDPVSNLIAVGSPRDVQSMLTRLIDGLKSKGITAVFTSLTRGDSAEDKTQVDISSLMDTWIMLRHLESNGERNRILYVLKSRGMPHSNLLHEYRLSESGIELIEPYIGAGTVVTGSARLSQELRDRHEELARAEDFARRRRAHQQKRQVLQAQLAALQAEIEDCEAETIHLDADERLRLEERARERLEFEFVRGGRPLKATSLAGQPSTHGAAKPAGRGRSRARPGS